MQIPERALRFRPFAGPADFAPMVACANASFAADGTGFFCTVEEVAGQVRTFIDATWNQANQVRRGWTEFISVGPRWRRRGLARALIARSLLAQREAGMRESGLGVDTQNIDGANRIDEASGFGWSSAMRSTASR